jgi:hypothetical protein
MAILTAKKTGKAAEAATWTPEVAPSSTSELVVPTGITVELGANLTVVSAKTEGTGTFTGNKQLTLSGSGNSLILSASTIIGSTTKILLSAPGNATTEPITNGADVRTLILFGTSTSKFKLKEAITATVELVVKGGIFKTEGFEVKAGAFKLESATGKEVFLGSSKLGLSGANPFASGGATVTFKAETSTIECTFAGAAIFEGGGLTFNSIVSKNTRLQFVSGGATVTTLDLSGMTGTPSELEIAESTVLTLTTFTPHTKQKIVRVTGGLTNGKLSKASGTVTLTEGEVEHITAEGGATWIVLAGTNLGGNTGWTFSTVDSRNGTVQAKGTSTESFAAKDARSAGPKASGERADAFKSTDTRSGTAKATGTRTDAFKASDARSGGASSSGTSTSSQAFTDARSGTGTASGQATDALRKADARSGTVTAVGSRLEQLHTADARTVTVKASGSFTQSFKAVDSRTGTSKASGTKTESWSHAGLNSDSANGTAHASGTRKDAYKAADISHGAAKASSTAHDSYSVHDARSGTVTATGTSADSLRFSDHRIGTAQSDGEGQDGYTRSEQGSGGAVLTGSRIEALRFADLRTGVGHTSGSATDSYTTPLKPALVTVRLRHSALIKVQVRR